MDNVHELEVQVSIPRAMDFTTNFRGINDRKRLAGVFETHGWEIKLSPDSEFIEEGRITLGFEKEARVITFDRSTLNISFRFGEINQTILYWVGQELRFRSFRGKTVSREDLANYLDLSIKGGGYYLIQELAKYAETF